MSDIGERQMRMVSSDFTTRDEDGNPTIEGYFSVFNSNYDIGPGMSESVAPGAFDNTLGNDIRALINHDTTLVLGRTKSNTLELKQDSHGLWGKIRINPKDTEAMNLYARVERGDVSGCSFGFDIREEDTEISESGDVHWTIKDVELYEVSCCTFPAYEDTNISARTSQRDEMRKREVQGWKEMLKARLKDGTESDASQEAD